MAGYDFVLNLTVGDILELNRRIASVERYGLSGGFGVKEFGPLYFVVAGLRTMARERIDPMKMAAFAWKNIACPPPQYRQPFVDANRRTGYLLARHILRAFGYGLRVTPEDAAEMKERIMWASLEAVERWLYERARRISSSD